MNDITLSLHDQILGVLRVLLAGVLAAIVGYERESEGKAAGLRTHILVGVGACLFTFAGLVFGSGDNGRVAAGVVTGVGFLGAGAIMRQEGVIHGLTTAAGVWVVAAIGVAVGTGLYLVAAVTTAAVFITLRFLQATERRAGGPGPSDQD